MPQVAFGRHSYQARALPVSAQRLVNMYAEANPQDTAAPVTLYGAPGIAERSSGLAGNVRGMVTMGGVLYAVAGNTLYSVASDGTETSRGTVNSGARLVGMAVNQSEPQELVICDGTNGWTYDTTNGLRTINDADFLSAECVTYQDGYFIFARKDTDQFFISNLNDGRTYTGTDIASAEGAPDLLLNIKSVARNLWLLGETSTEVWFNSGDTSFPFERQAFFPIGCLAKFSAAEIGGSLLWLACEGGGSGRMIVSTQGGAPQRVSTHAVEEALRDYSTVDDAEAFGYSEGGHFFYVLTFPTEGATWVYDLATGLWHERSSTGLGRWRARCYAHAYGRHFVGDVSSSVIGELDLDTFAEYGDEITFEVTSPPQYADRKRVFFSRLELFFEAGVGLSTGQGSDPQVWLDWSEDGGRTWSAVEPARSLGGIGEYQTRVVWHRLGSGRARVFRVRGSDPVKRSLVSAHLEAQAGAS